MTELLCEAMTALPLVAILRSIKPGDAASDVRQKADAFVTSWRDLHARA